LIDGVTSKYGEIKVLSNLVACMQTSPQFRSTIQIITAFEDLSHLIKKTQEKNKGNKGLELFLEDGAIVDFIYLTLSLGKPSSNSFNSLISLSKAVLDLLRSTCPGSLQAKIQNFEHPNQARVEKLIADGTLDRSIFKILLKHSPVTFKVDFHHHPSVS
jgi:hypothetical protein